MSVSFKIYFEKNGGYEIRRFSLDKQYSLSLDCVINKICHLYSGLKHGQFDIFWKDIENDKISIFCNEEFITAINVIQNEMKEEVVKLYIALSKNNVSGNEEPDDTAAPVDAARVNSRGVDCAGCNQYLEDTLLYKCVTCPNYDLCNDCIKKDVHLEHVMLRVPSHQALKQCGIFAVDNLKRFGPSGRRSRHSSHDYDFPALIVPLEDHYNVDLFEAMQQEYAEREAKHHNRRSLSSSRKSGSSSKETPTAQQQSKQKHHHHHDHSTRKRSRREPVNPFEGFHNIWRNVMSEGVVQDLRTGHPPVDNVIKGVADILASINISCPDQRTEESAEGSNNTDSKKPEEKVQQSTNNKFSETETKHGFGAVDETSTKKVSPDSCNDNDGIRVSAVEEDSSDVTSEEGARMARGDSEELGWTFVDQTSTGAIPKRADPELKIPPVTSQVYPNMSDIPSNAPTPAASAPPPLSAASSSPASKIASDSASPASAPRASVNDCALNRMLAMGFTNEDGWLEKLLANNEGSIEKVLDILMPASMFRRDSK